MAGKGSSMGPILGAALGTAAAIGGGFVFGAVHDSEPVNSAAEPPALPKAAKTPEAEVKLLAPIITNLAFPSGTYVRLEVAIVVEPGTPDSSALAAKVAEDIVVFMRTVSIAELQGPTAFQYFREDLKKRGIKKGGGKVRDLFLVAFIVE